MAESVYKIIELVGTSTQSWEKAAAAAVKLASLSLRDLRVAEVSQLDMHLEDGKVLAYRAKVKLSFKYTTGESVSEDAPAPKAAKAPRAAKAPKAEPEEAPAAAKKAPRKGKKRPAKKG